MLASYCALASEVSIDRDGAADCVADNKIKMSI
jgi:hypothetical protein